MRRTLLVVLAGALALLLGAPLGARLVGAGPDPALVGADGRLVELGGGRALRVVEHGAGLPIVLVHGLPSNVGDWGALPEALAARGHRVIAYDRIGYGRSSRAPAHGEEFTYGSNARDLLALLDRLGLARATLVGWSYGGGIVQDVAVGTPERVAQLVLVASVGPPDPGAARPASDLVFRLAQSPIGPPLFAWVARVPPVGRAVVSASVADAFSGAEHVPAGWSERTLAQLALPGTMRTWIEEERRADPQALQPARITAPTLVIQGDADRLVRPRTAELLRAQIPGSTLETIPGGSHMIPATHAERLADLVHAFATAPR